MPAAGSFSSFVERGLVVFFIGFLSASGPGACQRKGSHCCREGGRGCSGVEAGGLMWGCRRQGGEGGRHRRLCGGPLVCWLITPSHRSVAFDLLFLLFESTLSSILWQEGLWVCHDLQMGTVRMRRCQGSHSIAWDRLTGRPAARAKGLLSCPESGVWV